MKLLHHNYTAILKDLSWYCIKAGSFTTGELVNRFLGFLLGLVYLQVLHL